MHFTVVSYTFPPSTKIGGRRWAKFSLEIKKAGHEVTVVTANDEPDYDFAKREYKNIIFKFLPRLYPTWLTGITVSYLEKFLYAIAIKVWQPINKKSIFDSGCFWRKSMLHALEQIHKEKEIDILIVTGAPFSLLRYGAEFRKKHPSVYYIVDFRDPWTWGDYYGFQIMKARQIDFQEESEYLSVSSGDLVCYPTENMGNFLKKKYPAFLEKFCLLPHAFDPEKYTGIKKDVPRSGFIYGGTLYDGIEPYLQSMAAVLNANPSFDFRWDIYTGSRFPIINEIFQADKVKMHPFLTESELFQKITNSKAYLAFFPESDKDQVSTKFFEIINTRTPIIYIGEAGELGDFITNNHLGVHILPNAIRTEIPKYINGEIPFKPDYFDVSQFSFPAVTSEFLKVLSRVKKSAATRNLIL